MSVLEAVLQTLKTLKFDNSIANSTTPDTDCESLETAEKLRVFHTLPTVAMGLGKVETREKLIPVISAVVENAIDAGDDEVLMIIAQKLGEMVDYIGDENQISCILPILENIIYGVEEVVVAEATCDSLISILPKLNREIVESVYVPMIRHIIEEDLYCASRKVVSRLIIACYPLVSSKNQVDFKYRLFHLTDSEDEVPLVRAAAVHQLVPLAKLFGPELKSELLLLLTSLVSENQRIVRAACLPALVELGRMLVNSPEFDSNFRPCIEKLANDQSRDVRRAMALVMADLQSLVCSHGKSTPSSTTSTAASTTVPPSTNATLVGQQSFATTTAAATATATNSLHQLMLSLLEDSEVETRRLSASQLKDFCLASPKDILISILLPRLREHLSVEREERVRSELVKCAVDLLPSIRREDYLPLVQYILAFLNDSSTQSKQYVFEHFAKLTTLMNANEIQLTLLPSLLRLWQDKNWRVRLGVVQSVPLLYDKLPEACLQDTVLPATLAWLRDSAWCVRECACRSFARLLAVCPNASKKAFHGFGSKSLSIVNPTAPSATPSATTTASATSTPTPAAANSALQQSPNALASSNPAEPTALNNNPVNVLTSQAAAGGLKALACDPNYHFRQIYINVVQAVWGPGIIIEPVYTAFGDSPSSGLHFAATHNIQAYLKQQQPKLSQQQSHPPDGCIAPPKQMPTIYLTECVNQLLHFVADDAVPNVRICATQSLKVILGSLDKRTLQNEIVAVLKKAVEHDTDQDVRYFAQETLSFMTST